MKFLWLYKNNDHVKMASTAMLWLEIALFSCSRFRSLKFIISHTLLLTCLGYVANALENETANEAFCKFSYLKCRRIKKTSWFVNRPRKCFLTFFLNATSCANIKAFRGYRSEPKNVPGEGVLPHRGLWKYVRPQRVWFLSRFGHKEGHVFVL